MKKFRKTLTLGILVLCLILASGHAFAEKTMIVGNNGMVSARCPMAAEAGLEILRLGGNAFDAMAAIGAVQAITIAGSCSAGGGGWEIMYVKDEDKVICLDHKGRIPHAATAEMFRELGEGRIPWQSNYLSQLVPGNVGGWYELHRRYGSLPLEQVWARAIDYAENGFPGSEDFTGALSRATAMMEFPTSVAVYFPDGRAPVVGEICYNKDLANTYRMIIEHGIEWLYKGEGAEMIVAHVEKTGGLITARDLAEFSADWWEPASVDYKGYQFFTPPPEASNTGIIALETLKIMEGYDLKEWGLNSLDYIHHMAEAFKIADADYYQLCIPEERGGGPIPVEWLLSEEHAAAQRERINPTRASAVPGTDRYLATESTKVSSGLEYGEVGGSNTLIVTVADQYGNCIATVQSAGLGFGTRVVVEGLGFNFTSMIQFADRNPDYVWAIKGGLKTPTTLTPFLVMKDGKPWAVLGSGGTETILQGPVQIALNMIEFGMTPKEAIGAPRNTVIGTWVDPPGQPGKFEMHRSNILRIEPSLSLELALNLANRGHFVQYRIWGNYSMIVIDPETGVFYGVADPRARRGTYAVGW